MNHKAEAARVAADVFGYESLRPGQDEAIAAVLDGRDVLAVMPTGAGKSAIYQIAAVLLPGTTIVVSPLIALQHDQVQGLTDVEAGGAVQANSTMGTAERDKALADLRRGNLEFLFVAPEQFANELTMASLERSPTSLFVVDEAHCISAWGHDFRPDYLELGEVAEALGRPAILALTATAAPPVRAEIIERLGMRDPVVVVAGFDRPNIHLTVEFHADETSKHMAFLDAVHHAAKPGIVYTATRQQAEDVADELAGLGVRAAHYHGGMAAKAREATQEAFMDDALEVVVATVAFGMGIDKPNVRFVHPAAVSESIDAYYQEIGRAGRDGAPAEARLFYRPDDLGLRKFFAGTDDLDRSRVEMMRTYAELRSCRRAFILNYFGEQAPEECGACDNCEAGFGPAEEAVASPFRADARVAHTEWGEGLVVRLEGDTLTVLFDDAGYKTLSVPLVLEGGLLRVL